MQIYNTDKNSLCVDLEGVDHEIFYNSLMNWLKAYACA